MEAARTQFDKLGALMDSMTTEALHAAFSFPAETRRREAHWQRDRCVRDVLVHLHEWHRLLLSWVEANQAGRPQPFLPEPYTWRTYGTFNEQIWRDHQPTSLDTAVALLQASHQQVMELMSSFDDAQLFEKGHFAWTGTTTLGSYCVSATSSHYEWALKKFRAHVRACPSR